MIKHFSTITNEKDNNALQITEMFFVLSVCASYAVLFLLLSFQCHII